MFNNHLNQQKKDAAKPRPIFTLENVSVHFDKHAIRQRSLKTMLGQALRGGQREQVEALRHINLTIREGEQVGLIGRNGAGKSTLLRVVTGVIFPQSGMVKISHARHIVPLLELGIGFQPDLSGRENCILAGIIMGYRKAEIEARMESIIAFSELGDFIDEPVKHYSSGMYARLAFAIATDVRPDVLVVDEVFGVGDEFFMRKCTARMQQLMDMGRTTIFVSHNLDYLLTQCSRLIWLDRGLIVRDGDPLEVAEAYRGEMFVRSEAL
ncbi:MAG: ABC transporter ATP-binding protein [Calditrichaeota bacterium]|nr:ABC transporter ATP-binding protein [Calditrichota bacterium]